MQKQPQLRLLTDESNPPGGQDPPKPEAEAIPEPQLRLLTDESNPPGGGRALMICPVGKSREEPDRAEGARHICSNIPSFHY